MKNKLRIFYSQKIESFKNDIFVLKVSIFAKKFRQFHISDLLKDLLKFKYRLRYFNFESSFKLRCCRAQDLFGSQIPVTTGGCELRIFCIRSSYPTH